MPIRFRCVYCDRLLGIARRKAGAVVNCPHCSEKLIVPTPDPDETVASVGEREEVGSEEQEALVQTPAARLFEQDDVDAILEGLPTFRAEQKESPPPPPQEVVRPTMAEEQPIFSRDVQAAANARSTRPINLTSDILNDPKKLPGYHLSPAKATWLSVLVVILIAVAFAGGLMVGRFMKG